MDDPEQNERDQLKHLGVQVVILVVAVLMLAATAWVLVATLTE